MNVTRDAHASMTFFLILPPRCLLYNRILAHLLPSVECVETVWFITTDVLWCHWRMWKRHLKGIYLASVLFCLTFFWKKGQELLYSPLLFPTFSFLFSMPLCFVRGIITALVNISYTSIPLLLFTWQIRPLIHPRAQQINKTHPTEKPGQPIVFVCNFSFSRVLALHSCSGLVDSVCYHGPKQHGLSNNKTFNEIFSFSNSARFLFDKMFWKLCIFFWNWPSLMFLLLDLYQASGRGRRRKTKESSTFKEKLIWSHHTEAPSLSLDATANRFKPKFWPLTLSMILIIFIKLAFRRGNDIKT